MVLIVGAEKLMMCVGEKPQETTSHKTERTKTMTSQATTRDQLLTAAADLYNAAEQAKRDGKTPETSPALAIADLMCCLESEIEMGTYAADDEAAHASYCDFVLDGNGYHGPDALAKTIELASYPAMIDSATIDYLGSLTQEQKNIFHASVADIATQTSAMWAAKAVSPKTAKFGGAGAAEWAAKAARFQATRAAWHTSQIVEPEVVATTSCGQPCTSAKECATHEAGCEACESADFAADEQAQTKTADEPETFESAVAQGRANGCAIAQVLAEIETAPAKPAAPKKVKATKKAILAKLSDSYGNVLTNSNEKSLVATYWQTARKPAAEVISLGWELGWVDDDGMMK